MRKIENSSSERSRKFKKKDVEEMTESRVDKLLLDDSESNYDYELGLSDQASNKSNQSLSKKKEVTPRRLLALRQELLKKQIHATAQIPKLYTPRHTYSDSIMKRNDVVKQESLRKKVTINIKMQKSSSSGETSSLVTSALSSLSEEPATTRNQDTFANMFLRTQKSVTKALSVQKETLKNNIRAQKYEQMRKRKNAQIDEKISSVKNFVTAHLKKAKRNELKRKRKQEQMHQRAKYLQRALLEKPA